jgi:L-fuconolactonase
MIVDTHVHIVSDNNTRYKRIDEGQELALPPTTVDVLLLSMAEAGVDRATLVQAYFTYRFDNSYLTDAANAHPDRFATVCVLDPLDKSSPDRLSVLVTRHGVRGLRLMNDRGRTPVSLDDPSTFPLWERAAEHNIPVCIAALLGDVPLVRVPLARFPNVKVVLDHIWGLNIGSGPPFDLLKPVFDLAEYPNFYLKVAPTNTHAVRQAKSNPIDLYGPLIERFGARRIMWGSNFPVRYGGYGSLKERIERERNDFAFLSDDDRRWIFGDTALSLWPALRAPA